ncbi:hypothetical protein [Tunicatimonas pelagia]|uniref:hypothetical protein n=1 Tax=Tunicatimonas pelagia TaxID=931531 RepID=UPI002665D37F|nr:hypothetical protein [Tunicatimonas pelagia]WKN43201.1 hypothetical protein P0M28_29600 [Tunicatimonas pelagia]
MKNQEAYLPPVWTEPTLFKSQYRSVAQWQFNYSIKQPLAGLFLSGRYFRISKPI